MILKRFLACTIALAIGTFTLAQDECSPEPEPYLFKFVDGATGNPVPNVTVWAGLDGSGPMAVSDELGQAVLELDAARADITFAYERYSEDLLPYEYLNLITYLDRPIESENAFSIASSAVRDDYAGVVAGTVSGVDTGVAEDSVVSLASAHEESMYYATYSEFGYELPLWSTDRSYVVGTQYKDVDTLEYIPLSVGLHLGLDDLSESVDVDLDNPVNGSVIFEVEGVDSSMTYWYPDFQVYLPEDAGRLWYSEQKIPLDNISQYELPVPSMIGSLESSVLGGSAAFSGDDGSAQSVNIEELEPGSTVSVTLPPLHDIDDHTPISESSWPGTRVDLLEPLDGVSEEIMSYLIQRTNTQDETWRIHRWWIGRETGSSAAMTVPRIPHGVDFDWSSSDPGYQTTYEVATSYVIYQDSRGESASLRPLTLRSESKARVVGPMEKRLRMRPDLQ